MKPVNFKYFINEEEGLGLTIFDLDETLFHTYAEVKVIKNGKEVASLTNQEFNGYKLKPGESFDFGEFRSAETFAKTSTPIAKMIGKAKAIIRNSVAKGSRVIISTARKNFDNKELFLNTLNAHGIDTDNVRVERAGNLDLGSTPKNKKAVLRKYLRSGIYKRVRFFDDDLNNVNSFKSLEKEYPNISFEAWHVQKDGSIKKI
jgi:hypothetical protein